MRFIEYVRCVGLSLRESSIVVAAENHLPHPSHCFARFEGSTSPIQVGDKNPPLLTGKWSIGRWMALSFTNSQSHDALHRCPRHLNRCASHHHRR